MGVSPNRGVTGQPCVGERVYILLSGVSLHRAECGDRAPELWASCASHTRMGQTAEEEGGAAGGSPLTGTPREQGRPRELC